MMASWAEDALLHLHVEGGCRREHSVVWPGCRESPLAAVRKSGCGSCMRSLLRSPYDTLLSPSITTAGGVGGNRGDGGGGGRGEGGGGEGGGGGGAGEGRWRG